MKLLGWNIDRFGVLENFDVTDLPPGITVFHGPNESGKSTLLDYLRSMLFGFAPASTTSRELDRHVRWDTSRCGGNLKLQHEDGLFTIERSKPAFATNKVQSGELGNPTHAGEVTDAEGTFLLRSSDGSETDSGELERLLGPVNRALFETIFAFSLEELVLLKTLSPQGVQDKIYSAGIRQAGRAARAWMAVLDEEAAAIWNNGAPGPAVERMLEQWQSTRKELRLAREKALTYPRLLEREAAMQKSRESLAAQHESIRHECARAKRLIELHSHWVPIRALRDELREMPAIDTFVEDPETRLEECLTAIEEDRAARDRFEKAYRDDAEELDFLKQQLDEHIFTLSEAVANHPDSSYYRDRCELQDTGEMLVAERTAYVIRLIDRLGSEWDEARIMAHSKSRDQEEELESWAARLDKMQTGLADTRTKLRQCEEHLRDAQDERERLRDVHHQAVLDQTETLEKLQIRLQVKSDKQERIVDIERELDEAYESADESIPRWWAPGAAMAGVSILEASAWSLTNGHTAMAGIGMAGALLCGFGAVWWWRRSGVSAEQQEYIDDVVADLEEARLAIQPDIDENGIELSKTAEAAASVEVRTRATAQAADALVLADKQVSAAKFDVDHLRKQLSESEKTWEMVQQTWNEWVATLGFESGLTPEQVSELWTLIENAKPALAKRKAHAALLDRLKAECSRWISITREFLDDSNRPVDTVNHDAILQAFETLRDDCRAELRRRERIKTLEGNIEQARIERTKLDELQNQVANALLALLDEVGAESEADFREKHRVYKARLDLKDRMRRLETELDEKLGTDSEADDLRAQLESGGPEAWQAVIDDTEERANDLMARRDEVIGDLREVERERSALEEDASLPALQRKCAGLESALADELNLRLSLVIERELVERSLTRFLEEQQPAVLKETGRIFSRLTEGRYTDLILKEDGRRLVVRTAEGVEVEPDQLSLGTGELLYLCMRFGLIKSFSGQGVSLPLVMDDVLVNFDPHRARCMGELLHEIASDQQILFFTCHPQTVELLQDICPDLRVESMPGAKKHDAVAKIS